MPLELVSIDTVTEPLDGLLWMPDREPRAAILLFHGNTTNFYTGPSAFLAPALTAAGYACLAFNRRGHDILTTLPGKRLGGGAFQTAREDVADNEAASAYLGEIGLGAQLVVGHSNGGTLGAEFAATHPDLLGLVLLSAHAGGPGTYRRTSGAGRLAGTEADAFLARAEELVAAGRGRELLFTPHWWNAISAESLVDRNSETPDLLRNAGRITCPSLYIVGAEEPPEIYPAAEFVRRTPGAAELQVIEDCDHWYTGRHEDVCTRILAWLHAL